MFFPILKFYNVFRVVVIIIQKYGVFLLRGWLQYRRLNLKLTGKLNSNGKWFFLKGPVWGGHSPVRDVIVPEHWIRGNRKLLKWGNVSAAARFVYTQIIHCDNFVLLKELLGFLQKCWFQLKFVESFKDCKSLLSCWSWISVQKNTKQKLWAQLSTILHA